MNESEANPNMDNKCPQCGAPLPSGVLAGLCPACLFKQGAAADTAVPPETAAFQPPSIEEVAKLFPQLEIIAFIGKGGMGAVYKARQRGLDRIVALKIIPPQTAAGPGFIERFNREARALAKLNHPNIVGVYEFGQVNGLPFFIMEFVDGLNLRQLERAGKLSAREALQIVPQICEALQFAHDEGIVHRDIKPENILLDKKGRVKIADFGIAKILSGGPDVAITETGGAIGTPHYMAPEQMEKPTTVDHRADIFSLGVVFYEMLTGELPLGKFAPPSSRKVEVDVRLDDVVLRALEKDPERRYQHASQVKTAVDTIAGSAAPPPLSDAKAMAEEILALDYDLDIRSCVTRGWNLLRSNFWPFVGITALVVALMGFATSIGGDSLRHVAAPGASSTQITSGFAMLVWGPLAGGLYLYLLKKMRGEKATVETVFSGFSHHFLHLFLGGFVSALLTWLGFICLVLPGIYLTIAWMFTLPLIAEKQLDFWSAMELSRKVVTKHWFKFLGFGLVCLLLMFAGALAFGVGLLVAIPWVLAAMLYAYEDVFSTVKQTSTVPPMMGPTGTSVFPNQPARPSQPARSIWTPAVKIGLAGVAVVIFLFVVMVIARDHRRNRELQLQTRYYENSRPIPVAPVSFVPIEAPVAEAPPQLAFGPVLELELQVGGTNQFLDLDKEQTLTPPPDITNALIHHPFDEASGMPLEETRLWEALDIRADSRRFKYVKWLQENGIDLMYAEGEKIIGFDSIFVVAHGNSSTNWDDWDGMTPEEVYLAVNSVESNRGASDATAQGETARRATPTKPVYASAVKLRSSRPGGPTVNLLTRDQSVTWFFKTREGAEGILQLVSFTNDPPVVKIRYKLIQQTNVDGTAIPLEVNNPSIDTLSDRFEAASMMNDFAARNRAMSSLAMDAAKAGNAQVAKESLQKITDFSERSDVALETVRALAKRGLRKPALEIAKSITDFSIRDQALSELAQQ